VKSNPYRTAVERPVTPEEPPTRGLSLRASAMLGLVPLLLMGACQAAVKLDWSDVGLPLFCAWLFSLVACLLLAASLAWSRRQMVSTSSADSPTPREPSRALRIALLLWAPLATIAYFLYELSHTNLSRGRQLVRRGRVRLPDLAEVAPSTAWPEVVVRGWLANARAELASVAAFSHLSNELLALGAAPALIEGALRAAIEEVEHAKACFQVVGAPYAVDRFPAATWPADRAPTPRRLAVSCLRDACVLEHASALVAARLAARSDLPAAMGEVLARIAREEASHAEHGWQILAYLHALPAETHAIGETLERALAALEREPPSIQGLDDLESFGLASTAMWSRAVADAVQDARVRLRELRSEARHAHEMPARAGREGGGVLAARARSFDRAEDPSS